MVKNMLRQLQPYMIAVIALGTAAAAPVERNLINPYWLEQPTQGQVWQALIAQGRAYRAYRGSVSMFCTITDDGHLAACTVPDANTPDVRLKNAALSLAPLFKTKRRDSVGEDVAGARTLITLDFQGPPASKQIEHGLQSHDAAADLDCAVAALRHWAEDGETVVPAVPPLDAYVPQAGWSAQRQLLQAQQHARDTEVQAFYEGRLTVRAPDADLRTAVFEANRDDPDRAANDAKFAGCEHQMMALRYIPLPLPPFPIP